MPFIYMFIILAHKTLEITGGALWSQMCTYSTTPKLMIYI